MMKIAKNLLRWAKRKVWIIIFYPDFMKGAIVIIKWADGSRELTLDPHRHD